MPATNRTVWKIATIALLARQTITLLDDLPAGVREIDADLLDEPVEVDRTQLRDFADRLVDLTSQIELIASALPDRPLSLDRAQLSGAADLALRHGIAVPEQAMFAARLLPYRDAYRTIAHALRTNDARRSWDDLTVTDLLGNTTGATVELGRIVAALAGLTPTTELETSMPGVFAVGDVRSGAIRRVAAAVGEGSMAVRLVHEHLARDEVADRLVQAPERPAHAGVR